MVDVTVTYDDDEKAYLQQHLEAGIEVSKQIPEVLHYLRNFALKTIKVSDQYDVEPEALWGVVIRELDLQAIFDCASDYRYKRGIAAVGLKS